MLAYCTTAVPFCVWMLKGYFDTIPISLEEAGRIDGLTPFGTFWRIVIPLLLPGLAVTFFYSFITAWNEVAFANVLLVSDKSYTLPVGLQTYVFQFEQQYWVKLTAACGHRDDSRHDRVPVRPALPGERADTRRGERVITSHEASARRRRARSF